MLFVYGFISYLYDITTLMLRKLNRCAACAHLWAVLCCTV